MNIRRPRWKLFLGVALLIGGMFFLYLTLVQKKVPPRKKLFRRPGANILLITLDTTRPDRIGAYGYSAALTPELDRLARAGVLFKNAYSPVPLTLPAHASILTGTIPLFHGVRNNGKYLLVPQAITLAEILKPLGYTTAAFVSSFILDSRFGLDQGFDIYSDRMDEPGKIKNLESERKAASVYEDFARWFDDYQGDRFLAWVHFFDPHAPYDPPEPFRSDPRLPDPYDGEIAYMDLFVGKIIRHLESRELLQSTLVILAGDHGEAFGEHKENGHTIFCYEENIRVPLIFFGPGAWPEGTSISDRVNLIDILPTVLDFLKVKTPTIVQGRSLIPLVQGRHLPEREDYFESLYSQEVMGCAPLQGVLAGNFKFIRLPKPELYDLANDNGEKYNLADARPEKTRMMAALLDSVERKWSEKNREVSRILSREEKKKLESLGYVAGVVRPEGPSFLDPKDRIDFWNQSQQVSQLLAEKKYDSAEKLLVSLFEEDPHFHPVIENLAVLYFNQGKIQSLISFFEQAIANNRQSSGLRILYGSYLVRCRLAEQAIPILEEAVGLAGPDEMEQAHFTLGSAYGQVERYEQAALCFQKTLQLEPENYEASRLLGYSLMRLGKYEEALKYFSEAEKGIPDDPRLLEDTAMSLASLGRFLDALPYFERAVKLNPTAPLYINYALAMAELGNYGQAISLMETALLSAGTDSDLQAFGRRKIAEWLLKK